MYESQTELKREWGGKWSIVAELIPVTVSNNSWVTRHISTPSWMRWWWSISGLPLHYISQYPNYTTRWRSIGTAKYTAWRVQLKNTTPWTWTAQSGVQYTNHYVTKMTQQYSMNSKGGDFSTLLAAGICWDRHTSLAMKVSNNKTTETDLNNSCKTNWFATYRKI